VDWDESRRHETSSLMSESAPLAVEELGLGYRVETVIDDVAKDSPAEKAGLKKDDVIKGVQFHTNSLLGKPDVTSWQDVKPDQWAYVFWRWQNDSLQLDTHTITLRVETQDKEGKQPREVTLEADDDHSWPLVARGLILGMISINLAVINFLPIPVLDGGHMVFLLYERLRGRPAPEQVRYAATFVGLALIGSLMLFVLYLDAKRWLF